jgi:adenylate cyclase
MPEATEPAPAILVVSPDKADRRLVPVYDRLVVGRVCAGIDEGQRLLIDDGTISRLHLEVRLDFERGEAWLTDHSTNGTRLNGRRIERLVPVRVRSGDRVLAGETELEFLSSRFAFGATRARPAADASDTVLQVAITQMVMVVGDVASFSTIAETTDDRVLFKDIERLFIALRQILARHGGTLSNYAGDAFFATWEANAAGGGSGGAAAGGGSSGATGDGGSSSAAAAVGGGSGDGPALGGSADRGPAGADAPRAAVAFAVEAAATVPQVAAGLDLRDPGGGLLRMGWGVSFGQAAVSGLGGPLATVLGDATNVAFRLSGIAGRDGWPDVLVTSAVRHAIDAGFAFTPLPAVQVKGRRNPVEVLGAGQLLSPGGTTPRTPDAGPILRILSGPRRIVQNDDPRTSVCRPDPADLIGPATCHGCWAPDSCEMRLVSFRTSQ